MRISDWSSDVCSSDLLGLMRIFNLVCDLVAVHLQETNGNVEAFAQHRQGQIWMFLRAECLVDGVLDRDRLRYVTGREVQAGRMTEDDPLRRSALGDDPAFDGLMAAPPPDRKSVVEGKSGAGRLDP